MSDTAIVTAGGSNLGAAISLGLAAQGRDVVITYLNDPAEYGDTLSRIAALGRRAWAVKCDAGLKADVDHLYAWFAETVGSAPGVLVNNAGVQTWTPLLELKEEDWDRVIRTNLKGAFLNIQAAARLMVAAKVPGRIVNIGSGCNRTPFLNLVDYTASKGGIEMLTKSAAVELGPYGIGVNCVAPGSIETERTKLEAPNYARDWSKITPLRRIGTLDDVANAVCFLTDDRSGFITGQTLTVDGGVFTQTNWPHDGYS
jgi:3-oxoacyl-[acyl-carrier protein] reductase